MDGARRGMSGVNAPISPSVTSVIAAIPGLQALWAQTLGDPRITVAVLDGPVERSHPSLVAADLTEVETLIPGGPDAGPASQHGTHVASILFAQHQGPLRGLVPKCRGLIVPIYGDGPDGSLAPCSHIDLARALLLAAQHGARVVNISGGQLEPSGTAHPILADAVRHCADKGILIVAAAGNQGCDCLNVPATVPEMATARPRSLSPSRSTRPRWNRRRVSTGQREGRRMCSAKAESAKRNPLISKRIQSATQVLHK